ncbi:hypothetical protein BJ508DRAFT_112614 [Ascobolus immersus RN42]|uniref:Uncharacterized protein n=1 Tax=Ascobolus immersus RN42 TaxID=1160509 RepID=A0A3N4I5Y8_ASCIM|nr:hypothetical protein BJ508DRAFT_112614 [Ascobolus immersus RN42]
MNDQKKSHCRNIDLTLSTVKMNILRQLPGPDRSYWLLAISLALAAALSLKPPTPLIPHPKPLKDPRRTPGTRSESSTAARLVTYSQAAQSGR